MAADLAANFLRNAPPGEYEQCSACVHAITGDTQSLLEARAKSIEEWNFDNYTYVDMGDHGAIVCREARDPKGYFFDPIKRATFSYDFTTRKASEPTGGLCSHPTPLRDILQRHADAYLKTSFREQAAAGVYDYEGDIVIILRSSSISLTNFRTGAATSRYLLKDKVLTGWTRATQHFFETGNVMATQKADFQRVVLNDTGDPENLATEVFEQIKEFEASWMKEMLKGFAEIKENGLSLLRRPKSAIQTKINWAHVLTQNGNII